MNVYDWQAELYSQWKDNDYRGILEAKTGAGKTRAGAIVVDKYLEEYPNAHILILSTNKKINDGWMKELKLYDSMTEHIKEGRLTVCTYSKAVNDFRRNGLRANCIIADECHALITPKQGQVMEITNRHGMPITHILGMSATPEPIEGLPIIRMVGWEECNLCDFMVHYVTYTPTKSEMEDYNILNAKMVARANKVTGGERDSLMPGYDRDPETWWTYDRLSLKRREICYMFPSRIPNVLSLVKKHKGERTVIYTERREIAHAVHKAINDAGIPASIYVDGANTLSNYEDGTTDILVLCKKLREGWDDPTITVEIQATPTTTKRGHIQTTGRALRIDPNNPNKKANIYVLMAEGTSDSNVSRNSDFPKENRNMTTIGRVLQTCL